MRSSLKSDLMFGVIAGGVVFVIFVLALHFVN